MRAFACEIRNGREIIPGTVLEGKSFISLYELANKRFPCHWRMEIYFLPCEGVYGEPDKVIEKGDYIS